MALFNKGWSVTKGVEPLMGNWLESLDLRLAYLHCLMPVKLPLDTLKGALEVEKKSEMPVRTTV